MSNRKISIIVRLIFIATQTYLTFKLLQTYFGGSLSGRILDFSIGAYYLSVFQFEFYLVLSIFYFYQPARFSGVIRKSYRNQSINRMTLNQFFGVVYFGVLIIALGLPAALLYLGGWLTVLFNIFKAANTQVLENTALLFSAVIFLIINILNLRFQFRNAANGAKIQLIKLLLTAMVALPSFIVLYLLSGNQRADPIVALLAAFNMGLLVAELRLMRLNK